LGPALILVSNPTIQFMVFSKCREYWLRTRGRGSALSGLEVFALGAVAKIAATLVTYPYLLVKSNMQTQKSAGGASGIITRIMSEEGPSGFYKGLRSKIMQSVLMASLLFLFQVRVAERESVCVLLWVSVPWLFSRNGVLMSVC
jgi:adenine nucleotide transporter 17